MTSSFTHSRSGMSLMNVIVLLMLVGVLVMAGSALVGPLVKRGKITDTKTTITSAVDAIISWSASNGKIPTNTEYTAILPNPSDAWARPLVYAYDANLADPAHGGLCGRTTVTYDSIAFVVVSGGDDFSTESTPSTSQALTAAPDLKNSDIYRVVTLAELQSRAGCASTTPGQLRIANNELPNACAGSNSYSATLFADGGTPGYSWSLLAPPTWLTINTTTRALAPASTITATTGSYPITIRLTDSQLPTNTVVQRTLNLKVQSCGCPGYRVWNATGVRYDFKLAAPCENNIDNGTEITASTATPPRLLQSGGSIVRRLSQGNCNKPIQGQITYAQAVAADANGDCMVNYGPGDTVSER